MGMATIVAARAAGASTVIVTGMARDQFRLDCALQVGADHVIDVETEDPVERVREITGGRMADVVIDAAAGNPITVNLAMDLVHKGGHVVIAGMKDRPLEGFHSDWIPTRRITLHPGAGLDTEAAVALINAGKVPTAELLGETFPLERFEEAFALMTCRIPGATPSASHSGLRHQVIWQGNPQTEGEQMGAQSARRLAAAGTGRVAARGRSLR